MFWTRPTLSRQLTPEPLKIQSHHSCFTVRVQSQRYHLMRLAEWKYTQQAGSAARQVQFCQIQVHYTTCKIVGCYLPCAACKGVCTRLWERRMTKTTTRRCHQGTAEAREAEQSSSYLGTRPRAWGNEEVGDVLDVEQLFRPALLALREQISILILDFKLLSNTPNTLMNTKYFNEKINLN